MQDFAKMLFESVKEQFNMDIITNFRIFCIKRLREVRESDLAFYGMMELEKIIDIYGFDKINETDNFKALISPENTKIEWRLFKIFGRINYQDQEGFAFWKNIEKFHSHKYIQCILMQHFII